MSKSTQIRVYDNGGKTLDRFTVVYMFDKQRDPGMFGARGMSEQPFHPMGFGQFTTAMPGRHLGKRVDLTDLPEDCQALVARDLAGA